MTVKTIDVHEFKKCCEKNPDLCAIDVREIDEWESGRIPGTVHIPKDSIKDRIHEVTTDKCKPVYLHCKGGRRSYIAAEYLCEMGYTEVYSIDGGIMEWAMAGYPVEK